MNASNPPSRRLVRCPRCQKKTEYSPDNRYRPFCSERCQLIDLGEWADENFKIPDPQGLSGAVNENSEPDEEIH